MGVSRGSLPRCVHNVHHWIGGGCYVMTFTNSSWAIPCLSVCGHSRPARTGHSGVCRDATPGTPRFTLRGPGRQGQLTLPLWCKVASRSLLHKLLLFWRPGQIKAAHKGQSGCPGGILPSPGTWPPLALVPRNATSGVADFAVRALQRSACRWRAHHGGQIPEDTPLE